MAELAEMPAIVRLDLAVVRLPGFHPAAPSGARVPVYGFCILHPDGPILVDTGVGFGNQFIDDLYEPERAVLAELLDRVGIQVGQVAAVVNSHLHFDHCGQNPAFHGRTTPFWVQAAEYETLRQDPHYTDANWALAPEPQRRTVRGDERIAEGVSLIATPGHTAGHQSVLVEAANRRVVIGAQIVWHSDELTAEVASAANVDPNVELQAAAVDSIRRIKALNPETVHFSHCPALHATPAE